MKLNVPVIITPPAGTSPADALDLLTTVVTGIFNSFPPFAPGTGVEVDPAIFGDPLTFELPPAPAPA